MRLAFVTPRYGAQLVGGAEAQVREAAEGLVARGHEVEVLTTVAVDSGTWAPDATPGTTDEHGVTVRRFELVAGTDPGRRDALDHLVLSGGPLSMADELAWVDARFEVPALVRHLIEEGGGFDAVVYSPYLFWTTLRCLPLTRARSILVPCLHDEPAARLRTVRATLAAAGEVWFLSEPEHRLAHRLAPLGRHRVVGSAVPEPSGDADPEGFRRRHGLRRPFVLYAGRREDGKGWPQALAGFAAAIDRHDLDFDLVTFGSGAVHVGGSLASRVVDLGFLDAAEVPSAFAAASVLVQPSPNESFSRTVMEAWLAGVPVVATAFGEVVAWHCERSSGGLLYGDETELAECLRVLAGDPAARAELGAAGQAYARAHGTWPAVLDRMEEALAGFAGLPAGRADQLTGEIRTAAVQARRASVPLEPGFALRPWLPAPGAGTPATAPVDGAAGTTAANAAGTAAGDAAGAAPGASRLGAEGLALGWRMRRWLARRPAVRRVVVTSRAARAAWRSGAVAPHRDVR